MTSLDNDEIGVETKKYICNTAPGCTGCNLLVTVKDDKIVKLKGNRESPTRGFHCGQRFPHLVKWLEHPDQLMHPLKRVGERGENQWQKISFDQALDEIADKLKQIMGQYGAESLVINEGFGADFNGIRARLMNLIGNPGNLATSGTVCHCNKFALELVLGGAPMDPGIMVEDVFRGPKCLVFFGVSFSEAFPQVWTEFVKHLKTEPKKQTLIVVDPRRTKLADKADIWLQIRPGTDAALLLAWMNVIIEEGLYDKSFVDEWTFGFDQLKQRASEYTPERVAEITWIPAEKIRECARIIGTEKPSYVTSGLATDLIGRNAARVEQARGCLNAITGCMAALIHPRPKGPGPIINGKMGVRDAMLQLEEKCPPEQRKKQLGSDKYKLMSWPAYEITSKYYKEVYGIPQYMSAHSFCCHQPTVWNAVLTGKPYPVKAMITWANNPLLGVANTKKIYKALKSPNLELHVVMEHFMTPTALLADYILPSASNFERQRCDTFEDFWPIYMCSERPIKPMGERRSNYDFFRELAIRLGFGEYFPWKTAEEFHDYRLKPLGITQKEAATERPVIFDDKPWTYETINPKTGKPTGFATPSGKFELYSNVLEELGYDPLPFYEEPPESHVRTPDVARDFPLILTTVGRRMPLWQSQHRQLGMGLREQHPEPLLEIHPDTAKYLGISDGDWVYIETRRGVIKQKAELTPGIHPKVVNAEYGWWFPEQPAQEPWLHGLWESNANVLAMDDPDACDELTGGYACSALLCKVYKVKTP